MCRAGGPRCPGSGRRSSDDREAAEQRAQDTRDRVASGDSIDAILAGRQAEVSRRLLDKAVREDG